MRHGKRRTKLGMKTAQRNATMRNMVKALFKHQRIETTVRRAKEARRLAERLITMSKDDSIAARRMAYSILTDRDLVTKLFKEIAPLFKNRNNGFTRIIPLGFRRGDGASLAILELTEKKVVEKLPKKRKEKPKPESAKEPEPTKEAKKEEPKQRHISKSKPTMEEEKIREKTKTEDKRIADKKGFMKNLRGFFRRKTDM